MRNCPIAALGKSAAAGRRAPCGSVANFWKGYGNSYRWTQLCCERGELLKCGLATRWKLLLADHMCHFDAIQGR